MKSLKSDIKINKKQRRQAFPAVFHLSDLIDHFPCHCDTWKMFQQNHCTNSFCQTTITLMTLQFPSSWLVTNLQKMVTDQGGWNCQASNIISGFDKLCTIMYICKANESTPECSNRINVNSKLPSYANLKQYYEMSWEGKNVTFPFFSSYNYVMTLVVTVL